MSITNDVIEGSKHSRACVILFNEKAIDVLDISVARYVLGGRDVRRAYIEDCDIARL